MHVKLKTMPPPVRSVAFFFCAIGFKLKVRRFSRDELFEMCHDVGHLSPCHRFGCCAAGICASIPQREGNRDGEKEARKGRREREAERDKEVLPVPTLCIILHLMCVCVSLCVVCVHTVPMTHPKPRPARIQFESQVWRVQLRGTNAA